MTFPTPEPEQPATNGELPPPTVPHHVPSPTPHRSPDQLLTDIDDLLDALPPRTPDTSGPAGVAVGVSEPHPVPAEPTPESMAETASDDHARLLRELEATNEELRSGKLNEASPYYEEREFVRQALTEVLQHGEAQAAALRSRSEAPTTPPASPPPGELPVPPPVSEPIEPAPDSAPVTEARPAAASRLEVQERRAPEPPEKSAPLLEVDPQLRAGFETFTAWAAERGGEIYDKFGFPTPRMPTLVFEPMARHLTDPLTEADDVLGLAVAATDTEPGKVVVDPRNWRPRSETSSGERSFPILAIAYVAGHEFGHHYHLADSELARADAEWESMYRATLQRVEEAEFVLATTPARERYRYFGAVTAVQQASRAVHEIMSRRGNWRQALAELLPQSTSPAQLRELFPDLIGPDDLDTDWHRMAFPHGVATAALKRLTPTPKRFGRQPPDLAPIVVREQLSIRPDDVEGFLMASPDQYLDPSFTARHIATADAALPSTTSDGESQWSGAAYRQWLEPQVAHVPGARLTLRDIEKRQSARNLRCR